MDVHLPSFQDLLLSRSTIQTQLALVLINAIVWYYVIPKFAKLLKQHVTRQPYCKQFVKLSRKAWEECLDREFESDEDALDYSCEVAGALLQHLIGGIFCIPSIFFGAHFPQAVASALAKHGCLMEAGWEFQDLAERFYQVFVKNDWTKNSPTSLRTLVLHHSMGLSIIVPLNIYFGDNRLYHEGMFLMQGVSAFCITSQYYSYTLNTEKPWDMIQMKVLSMSNFLIMFYCRIIGFGGIMMKILPIIYDQNQILAIAGIVTTILMQYLNFKFLRSNFSRAVKYAFLPLPPVKKGEAFSNWYWIKEKLSQSIVPIDYHKKKL
mmetsp:Transcript_5982/g.6871  ORF Transcript_5982/g.6871 Transcript_5982/m.6871 type:complete len:321 (-) Transcript_5982:60-1022(-)|eukprot:CAMPEP_0184021934 /NCGR_PEP_ID=MMETSP0954-20121128/10253_1 /TAXON_ID=627963 /ORGANISM="Aplanochytrium sp, Strain PBS07" /LENGTH=320 /DNA_ID=CAMNT_0026304107 /DNA_START=40 /DNA_END=1002 /DNA_ORIENTATION=+